MALGSGTIAASAINTECGETSSSVQVSLDDVDVRTLAGISSGQISMLGLRSLTFHGGKGFWAGGFGGSNTNAIDGITFSSEASYNPSATLSDGAGTYYGSTYAGIRGFAFASSATAIDGFTFSNETNYNPSATLPSNNNSGVCSSATKGYIGGDSSSTNIMSFSYTAETTATISSILAVARGTKGALSAIPVAKGYFCGGSVASGKTTTYYTEIDGINYSNETSNNPSAVLADGSEDNIQNCGAQNHAAQRGLIFGGAQGGLTFYNYIQGLNFSNETADNPAATLASATGFAGVPNGRYKAFVGGGSTGVSTYTSSIHAYVFSNDTISTLGATLADGARNQPAKMSSGGNTIY